MKLSEKSFRDLANANGGSVASGKGTERRRSNRVDVQTRVPLSLITKGVAQPFAPVMVRDISPRGINILYPEILTAGQQFTVKMKGAEGLISLLCTVLHSRQVASGLFSVGAELTCVVPNNTPRSGADEETQKRIRESMLG